MAHRIRTVADAGLIVRAMRKQARMRIDDFALTAGVSKQFISDLENGKSTVQMGLALDILTRLGLYIAIEVPLLVEPQLELERTKALTKLEPGADSPPSRAGRGTSKRGTRG